MKWEHLELSKRNVQIVFCLVKDKTARNTPCFEYMHRHFCAISQIKNNQMLILKMTSNVNGRNLNNPINVGVLLPNRATPTYVNPRGVWVSIDMLKRAYVDFNPNYNFNQRVYRNLWENLLFKQHKFRFKQCIQEIQTISTIHDMTPTDENVEFTNLADNFNITVQGYSEDLKYLEDDPIHEVVDSCTDNKYDED